MRLLSKEIKKKLEEEYGAVREVMFLLGSTKQAAECIKFLFDHFKVKEFNFFQKYDDPCSSCVDKVFERFKEIHTLNMSGCRQTTITDKAFAHLKYEFPLNEHDCTQTTITDKAFVHLKGIHTLNMNFSFSNCNGIDSNKQIIF